MLNAADWTAIGTLVLAIGTFVLAWVTVRTSAAARHHDDEKRAEDRAADVSKRAEDRARDDRLREEAREQAEQHERAERIAREDYEARQVLVTVEVKEHPGTGHNFNRRVTFSSPHAYPIKQVEGCLVIPSNSGGLGIIGFGHSGDEPYVDDQRIYYGFWAEVPVRAPEASPIMRFVDWHGNRYYQYRHYTEPAATSPSSPRSRGPSPSRTRSARASTCSTPAPSILVKQP
jgi:hypothetical protein